MFFPAHIKKIGLFAPAFASDSQTVETVLRRFEDCCSEFVMPAHKSKTPLRYFAGEDQARAEEFNELLHEEDLDMMMALRGGYGCARMLPFINWNLLKNRHMPVVGYSDLTALHLAAWKQGCENQFFGPMLMSQFGREDYLPFLDRNLASLSRCLTRNFSFLEPSDMASLETVKPGEAEGALVPANLTVLESLLGTPYMPDLSSCILVLEDVGEASYSIDRTLNHLRQTGILERLSGLVFGQFTDCENGHFLPEILQEYAAFVNGPVVSGLPFGHTPYSVSLPVGRKCVLDAKNKLLVAVES